MPGCPRTNACVQPSWLTGRPRSTSTARRPDSRPGSMVIAFLQWERACLRRRWVRLRRCWIGRRHREQARSHKVLWRICILWLPKIHVGASLLAIAVAQPHKCRHVPRSCSCSASDLDLDLDAPLNHAGRTQALRSGHPGMNAGMALRGGPRSNAGVRAHRA